MEAAGADLQASEEEQRDVWVTLLAESEGTGTTDLVRLYKALGGGWTPRRPETSPPRI